MLILLCLCLSVYMLIAIDAISFSLGRRGWSRFFSSFLLFYGQIILSEFVLGLLSILYGYLLAAVNLAIATLILVILRRREGKNFFIRYVKDIRRVIRETKKSLLDDPFWLGLVILAAGFIIWVVFLGVLFPALDYDGNSYHLTYVADLIQNHRLYDPTTSLSWLAGYPKGGEFMQAWSVLLSHNDMLSDLTQVPYLILGVVALYAVAVRLGADRRQARFAATLFVFIPVVLNQLKTTYVDVMLCALFFASLAMIIRERFSKLDYLLIGILISLMISVKSTGFLFALVLLPLLIWNLYRRFGRRIRAYGQPLLLMVSPLFFGLYWYLKDYIQYGSPIYPFGFKIAGYTLFPGKTFQQFAANAVPPALPHGCVQRIWFVWTEQKDWFGCFYNYDTNYAGLGPIWFIILIPAFIISLYFGLKRKNMLYLSVAATILVLFAIYPTNYYSRYTMFITGTGIIGLGLALTYIKSGVSTSIKLLSVVLAISVVLTNFTLCNYPPGEVHLQFRNVMNNKPRDMVYDQVLGQAYTKLEHIVRPGETVAYSSKPFFIYPLWTSNFSDRVIFLPSSTSTGWLRDVYSNNVSYVFTTIDSKENRWAQGHMKVIYKDNLYEIFQTS